MAHIASAQTSTSSGSFLGLTIPATAAAGDVAIAQFALSNNDTAITPSGWSQVYAGTSGNLQYYVYSRTLTSGDPGATLTLATTLSTAQKLTASIAVVRDATLPPDYTVTPISDITTNTTRVISSTTLTGTRQVLTGVLARGNTTLTSWTAPSGFTTTVQVFNSGNGETNQAIGYANASAGSIGGGNWVSDVADARSATWIIVLGAPATPLPDPTFTTVVTDPSPLSASNGTVAITVTNHTSNVDHYVIESAVGHDATSGFTTHSSSAGSTYTITGLPGGPRTIGVTAYPGP